MSDFDPEAIATRLFLHLRQSGFNLGVGEYQAALDAIQGGMGTQSLEDFKFILQLLWCHSLAEQSQFALIWQELIANPKSSSYQKTERPNRRTSPVQQEVAPPSSSEFSSLAPLPVKLPLMAIGTENTPKLELYFPVTRRSMAYLWRYLRRPVAGGVADECDVDATVKQVAEQGFFLAPIYRRREVNHAQLLLLIDQNGSMTPFHRFTRDLVQTAQEDSTIAIVNVYYFHNVPTDHVYENAHCTTPVSLEQILSECDGDTSVLIVSDAGSARGNRSMARIRSTTKFLVKLKQRTNLIGWLNPMPTNRWTGTSAEMIAYLVSMNPMDDDGMSRVIDIVRGQAFSGQGS